MKTVTSSIIKAIAEATYCNNCEKDFTSEADKVGPSPEEAWFTGRADNIICESCADAEIDRHLEG
jgi:hypothetical protein